MLTVCNHSMITSCAFWAHFLSPVLTDSPELRDASQPVQLELERQAPPDSRSFDRFTNKSDVYTRLARWKLVWRPALEYVFVHVAPRVGGSISSTRYNVAVCCAHNYRTSLTKLHN